MWLLIRFSSFDSKQNSFYRGNCCIKFCSDLKELGTKIINYEEKDMIPLTDSEEQEKCRICQKEFCYDKNEKKKKK